MGMHERTLSLTCTEQVGNGIPSAAARRFRLRLLQLDLARFLGRAGRRRPHDRGGRAHTSAASISRSGKGGTRRSKGGKVGAGRALQHLLRRGAGVARAAVGDGHLAVLKLLVVRPGEDRRRPLRVEPRGERHLRESCEENEAPIKTPAGSTGTQTFRIMSGWRKVKHLNFVRDNTNVQ